MKKIFNIIILFILSIFLIYNSNIETKASYGLDQIDYYEIKIDTRNDGTLDMHFKITWTVLDSNSEGPLEWIKIGIPNCYVDEIKAISNNIDSIYYYSSGGAYIRIDLDRKYYEGETLNIEFTTHQSRLYNLSEQSCYYLYKPGWFNEIRVTQAKILWNKNNVTDHNATTIEGDYLVWEQALNYGETINIRIVYDKASFVNLSYDLIYSDSYLTAKDKRIIMYVIIAALIIVFSFALFKRLTSDPYMYGRGFYGRRYYGIFPRRPFGYGYTSSGNILLRPKHYGSGSSSSCACACACAGGGRAGCSKKDFYNSDLNKFKNYISK